MTENIDVGWDYRELDILVTGGTGTFGNALTRHLLAHPKPPRRLIILSRDEFKQHEMAQRHGNHPALRFFVGDVRDRERLKTAFRGVDFVIHAAAMKQVPACEYNPTEAVRTNIGGAENVVAAAIEAGVKRVVALSTDKACSPTNLYGATKLVAEKMFLAANAIAGALPTMFAVTRYGNVAGSRGSVIPVWEQQIRQRQMLTLTDPECTRFYMTTAQAVRLVLWTLENMAGGELVVPGLPAYKLLDLASAMDRHRQPVGRIITGMRQGEKMHESMISEHEAPDFRLHPETGYWIRGGTGGGVNVCPGPVDSSNAPRMTYGDLITALAKLRNEGGF